MGNEVDSKDFSTTLFSSLSGKHYGPKKEIKYANSFLPCSNIPSNTTT